MLTTSLYVSREGSFEYHKTLSVIGFVENTMRSGRIENLFSGLVLPLSSILLSLASIIYDLQLFQ